MASESAVLGVPAIYVATTGRGYTDEQESRYGLVRNLRELSWATLEPVLDRLLESPVQHWADARLKLLEDTVDVAAYVTERIVSCGAGARGRRCGVSRAA